MGLKMIKAQGGIFGWVSHSGHMFWRRWSNAGRNPKR